MVNTYPPIPPNCPYFQGPYVPKYSTVCGTVMRSGTQTYPPPKEGEPITYEFVIGDEYDEDKSFYLDGDEEIPAHWKPVIAAVAIVAWYTEKLRLDHCRPEIPKPLTEENIDAVLEQYNKDTKAYDYSKREAWDSMERWEFWGRGEYAS